MDIRPASSDESGETLDDIAAYFSSLTLETIVRKNRDKCVLSLASGAVRSSVTLSTPIQDESTRRGRRTKECLERWVMWTLNGVPSISGFPRSEPSIKWTTSPVVALASDKSFVLTKSGSLYELGTEHEGMPNPAHCECILVALNSWGYGKILGLPHMFY